MSVSWATADPPKAVPAGRPISSSSAWRAALLRQTIGIAGLAVLLVLWWGGTKLIAAPGSFLRHFSPLEAVTTLGRLATNSDLPIHVLVSLRRVLIGLGLALVIGVPIGLAVGRSALLNSATSPSFQFLRMISPLSWMPLAVMVLGVGDRPIYFLLAFAAVWPILLSTAEGVRQLQPAWLRLAASLSATRWETLRHVVLPGVLAHVLTGLRLAIGVVWIVLVPCEMLGVSAGLGYFILDTRDRLAYSELTAMVLVIGLLGFLLDAAARGLNRLVTHRH
ncbi:ABC transporter permease [Bradyrhizobium cytisi]|uniref:ABC transporter permease n=1 Tax=Bradyrhizobium cytisi TaxID=515489 RepID=A0A5S4X0F4_9BRAD|nr:ABC transporter permease [Bradyrhizobium cytisi]TYL85850.1 ABC transporter permease [Bradyrhizobium cytisi]